MLMKTGWVPAASCRATAPPDTAAGGRPGTLTQNSVPAGTVSLLAVVVRQTSVRALLPSLIW